MRRSCCSLNRVGRLPMLHKYVLGSEGGQGWAIIVIDTELNYFSTVSDWGSYAFAWGNPGMEFRKFLMQLSTDYLRSKLLNGRDHTDVFDLEATKQKILRAMEEDGGYDDEQKLAVDDIDAERSYEEWQSETRLDAPWEYAIWTPSPQCTAFCEKVMPRLKELLRAELENEQIPNKVSSW